MRKIVTLLLPLLLLVVYITPVYAISGTAPALNVFSAWAVRDVVETGDLLVTYRYTMPTPAWDPYGTSGAFASLFETTTKQTRIPPGLGPALGGFYLTAGNTFTWDAPASVSLSSNPTAFAVSSTANVNVNYLQTTGLLVSSGDDQAAYCGVLVAMLQAIEDQDSGDAIPPGTYVSGGNITITGTEVALAAFSAFADVMPSCFYIGVLAPTSGFNPDAPALRDARIGVVNATPAWQRFSTLAAAYGFADAGYAAALLGLSLAGLAMLIFSVITGSFLYAATVAGLVLLVGGMNAPGYLLQGAFVLAAVSAVGAGAFWSRQTP
jgi:hypothetical protein